MSLPKVYVDSSNSLFINLTIYDFKELGDLPDLPPPISAVVPPDMPQYSSTSIPRSASNQLVQAAPRQDIPRQEPTYHPSEDPDSNPFMNGDGADG